MTSKTIKIDHLYRVEGHGGIRVELDGKKILDVKMEIFEGSRFFEALIRGRSYKDVPMIMCRICAICSASHRLAAIGAIEKALELQVTAQTILLRELLHLGEIIESHSLHLFCLAAPDFLRLPGIAAMADRHEAIVRLGLGLKKLGNEIQELVGGRKIHPLNAEVGGFTKVPEKERMLNLKERIEDNLENVAKAVEFIESITKENITASPAVFSALTNGRDEYCYSGDTIMVSTDEEIPVSNYKSLCNESVVTHSHAKHSHYKNKPFLVGSLARLYFNRKNLTGAAAETMKRLEPSFDPDNILWNNMAQAIELQHCFEHSLEIIDTLMKDGYKEYEEPAKVTLQAGKGSAGIEAPRGTLFHSYTIDEKGIVIDADVITPTSMNLANIEKDIRAAVDRNIDDTEDELKLKLEKVARAYDPCISCSVHLVDVSNEKQL